jgi:lipopolysaccharide biosynthesis glycosyltransferase
MAKNIVFITALGYPEKIPFAKYSIHTWEWWCQKHNARLYVLNQNAEEYRKKGIRPTWARYHVFEILEQRGIDFHQVAMADADTMVRWDCPNFFNLTRDQYTVVRDTQQKHWVKKSIQAFQHLFPHTTLPLKDYFNAGFMIINPDHRQFFKKILEFYHLHEKELRNITRTKQKGSDQTPLNFLEKNQGEQYQESLKVNYLPREYNFMHFIPPVFNNSLLIHLLPLNTFIKKAYIWHFMGIRKQLNPVIMRRTWEAIKEHYA